MSKLPYDVKECAGEAAALCEKMHGKKCNGVLSVLSYQDEKDEFGCKLLFHGDFDTGPAGTAVVASMYGSALMNIGASIDGMARAIAKNEGPEAEKEFRRMLDEFVKKNCKSTVNQATYVAPPPGTPINDLSDELKEELKPCPHCGYPTMTGHAKPTEETLS